MNGYALGLFQLNAGMEMIYVLHSRLQSQHAAADLAHTVLVGVASQVFSTASVQYLSSPQLLPSLDHLQQLLRSMATSPAMQLDDSSLHKLVDLVCMCLKSQLLRLRSPNEMEDWTMNHIDGCLEVLPASTHDAVRVVREHIAHRCQQLTPGEWFQTRAALLNVLRPKHTKVSILMDNGLQRADGTLVVPPDQFLTPMPVCEPPGVIRYYSNNMVCGQTSFAHRDAQLPRHPPHLKLGGWSSVTAATRITNSGTNIFPHTRDADIPSTQPQQSLAAAAVTADKRNEMDYISRLAGGRTHGADVSEPARFSLHLFGEDGNQVLATPSTHAQKTVAHPHLHAMPSTQSVCMDVTAVRQQNHELLSLVGGLDAPARTTSAATDTNLLDLMDQL